MKFLLFFIFLIFNLYNIKCWDDDWNDANTDYECPTVPSTPEDRRKNKDTLRIVQYNVEWLFLDPYTNYNDEVVCPGSTCPWSDESEAKNHLNAISSVISDLNPDIINFVEIEGCYEIDQIIDTIGDDSYASYLLFGTDSYTGENVGLMTKIDPDETLWRSNEYYKYPVDNSKCDYSGSSGTYGCSKHYFTTITINDMKIAFIGAHLLAHPDDTTRCVEREAQASILREHIDDYLNDGYEIIMWGDFNDYDGEILDENNDIPISIALDILKGEDNEAGTLYSVMDLLEQDERYTEFYDENHNCIDDGQSEHSMIDHVLMTPNLREKVSNVFIDHGAYSQSCDDFYYSDHWPVVVDLNFATSKE